MAIVFLGDQLTMSSQQGIRCRQSGDLFQQLAAQPFGADRESTALVIMEAQPTLPELLPENSVLLWQILDDLLPALIHPASNRHQQELKGSEHSRHLFP